MPPLRTAARALAAGLALALAPLAGAAATPAPTPTASAPSTPPGLFGTQDPTFDGAYRQGLALLALRSGGREPAEESVALLVEQQCADGGWTAYRADPGVPCDAATEDSNSTGMALQALAYIGGREEAVRKGLAWFTRVQNADGGFGYNPGGASDANSTALVVSALVAAEQEPTELRNAAGRTPLDALGALQLRCAAPADQRGALAYQPDKAGALLPNDFATAQAALALAGAALPVGPLEEPPAEALTCPSNGPVEPDVAARAAAEHLARRLAANDSVLPSPLGPAPDYTTTATAVMALAATGVAPDTARASGDKLAGAVDAYAKDEAGADRPAALANLVLAARALGEDPRSFGGTDLVERLAATGPATTEGRGAPADGAAAGQESGDEETGSADDSPAAGLVVGAGILVLLLAAGVLLFVRLGRRS